eukprot:8870975-Pyramimonas_sp.AAC.2
MVVTGDTGGRPTEETPRYGLIIPRADIVRRGLLAMLLVSVLQPTQGWTTTSDMLNAHYLLVGRYMEQHFDRAVRMNEAVKAEYQHMLRLRGQAAANGVFQTKGSFSDDLAAIIVSNLPPSTCWLSDR